MVVHIYISVAHYDIDTLEGVLNSVMDDWPFYLCYHRKKVSSYVGYIICEVCLSQNGTAIDYVLSSPFIVRDDLLFVS